MPVERAEEASAVGGRKVHQDMKQHADERNGRQLSVREMVGCAPAIEHSPATPDQTGDEQPEADDAERSMRRPAMPLEVLQRSPGGRDDVDVRCVRGEDESGRRAAAAAAKGRPCQRRGEERMGQVIHAQYVKCRASPRRARQRLLYLCGTHGSNDGRAFRRRASLSPAPAFAWGFCRAQVHHAPRDRSAAR